ncbi:ABC transporter permease [Inediibacterium massiliense]|uniref:ABC transporter permease n=1 Tax=Inediibacterium massiliense TaxID=1658111 RepID=UPI0006B44F81|nr:ABC transporter permease [Inediibacterium massiliense]
MGSLIKLELKKILFKKRILIVWISILFLSFISIRAFSMEETYADLFSKAYGLVPFMGILMFMIFSGAYTLEYNSNMSGLIKTTKNGRKQIIAAKSIASGIGASILNLSIFFTLCLSAFTKFNFLGLNLSLKSLWYFENSGSDITMIQMVFIMTFTIILGSFFFAQIGLFLSSMSNSSAIPFVFGGLIMGLPYILEGFVRNSGLGKYLGATPLWGMMSCQLIRYKTPMSMIVISVVIFIGIMMIFPKMTYNSFLRKN